MSEGKTATTDLFRNVLALALIAAYVGALIVFSFRGIPSDNKETLSYMVGQLSGMATMALGFYFTNKAGQDALDTKRADNTSKALDIAAASSGPTGSADDPIQTEVVNTPDNPVPNKPTEE